MKVYIYNNSIVVFVWVYILRRLTKYVITYLLSILQPIYPYCQLVWNGHFIPFSQPFVKHAHSAQVITASVR